MERRNPYDILGIKRGASPEEIRAAWLEKALSTHPDIVRGMGVPEEEVRKGEEELKQVNWANDELADPQKRREYEAPPPILHVDPPTIRSTNVTPGTVLRASFVLYNTGGPPFAGSTISSGKMDPWIKFLPPESVDPNQKELLPLRIHLEVRGYAWNTRYTKTITISIGGASTSLFVELQTRVHPAYTPQPQPRPAPVSTKRQNKVRPVPTPQPKPIPASVSTKRWRSGKVLAGLSVIAVILILIVVDYNNAKHRQFMDSLMRRLEIEMPTGFAQENDTTVRRITVTSGNPIVFSAYTLNSNIRGNLKWEQRTSWNNMYLSPTRLTAIDYNGDGIQEEVLIQYGARTTHKKEEELFDFLVLDSDGLLLHRSQCGQLINSKAYGCSPQKAEAHYQQIVRDHGG